VAEVKQNLLRRKRSFQGCGAGKEDEERKKG